MIYIYRKEDGMIFGEHPDFTEDFFKGIIQDKKILKTEKPVANFKDYKIVDDKFIKLNDVEKDSISRFNKILNDNDYQYQIKEIKDMEKLKKLVPSREEIMKAEMTLEMLEVFDE